MKNINKILIIGIGFLFVSFSLLVDNGFCVGNIAVPFNPESTYPPTIADLKDLYNQTVIVENSQPHAVIVVDKNNPDYYTQEGGGLANAINDAIDALFPSTTVRLTIIDDNEDFLANPVQYYSVPLIMIGNYATNQAIEIMIYKPQLQMVDIGRPGIGHYVINNVRVGERINGVDHFTNVISIAGETLTEITAAVNYFKDNMLSAAFGANSIIFDETDVTKKSNYWNSDTNPTSIIGDDILEEASMHGNRYWLTGLIEEAVAFKTLMYNYGQIAENIPTGVPQSVVDQYWSDQTGGDNSGDADFHLRKICAAWRKIERGPYFIDLDVNPQYNEHRLYITKVINWLAREYYKMGNVSGALENYVARTSEPLGNHEVNAAFSILAAGKYFGEDDYDYNSSMPAFYTPGYPNDYAGGWIQAASYCFENSYRTISYPNDDSCEYWTDVPQLVQEYSWYKNSNTMLTYFDNQGGIFDNGEDRSIADLFLMLTPNIVKKVGFGDSNGAFSALDFEAYMLRFWTEQYQDEHYYWLFDRTNLSWLGPSEWGKNFHLFGLRDLESMGINPNNLEPPNYLLGVKIAPLEGELFAYPTNPQAGKLVNYLDSYQDANIYNGHATYSSAMYDEGHEPGEYHIADLVNQGAVPINKATLRSGFDAQDQYMLIDGIAKLGHGHDDHLAIIEFWDNGQLFLADHTWDDKEREFHNAVTIKKNGEGASFRSSTAAAAKHSASFNDTGFLDMALPDYGKYTFWGEVQWSTDLSRSVFWLQDKFFLVLDEVKANDSGNYELTLNWKALSGYSIQDPSTVHIQQDAEHCIIKSIIPNPSGGYRIDSDAIIRSTFFNNYLTEDSKASIPSLIYTYSGSNDPDYQLAVINNDTVYHVTSAVNNEDIYLGKSEDNTQVKAFGSFTAQSNMFYVKTGASVPEYFALVDGLSLSQGTQQLFLSEDNLDVSIEFDTTQLTGIIEVEQETPIKLYAPSAGYAVQIKELPNGSWQTIPASWENNLFTFTIDEPGKYEVAFVGPEPVLNNIENQEIEINQALEFTISADDPDSTTLAFRGYGYPFKHGAQLINNGDKTATFSWIPQVGDIGKHDVLFVVSDGEYTDSQLATITVLEEGGFIESSNVALNKTYKAAVNNAPLVLVGNTILTDGDISNYSQWNNNLDPWHLTVVVDLGQEISLSWVRLYTIGTLMGEDGGVIHPSSIDVFTSNDETVFPSTPDVSMPVTPPAQHPTWFTIESTGNFEVGTVSGRYVKFYFTFNRPIGFVGYNTYARVKEIEIYNYVNPSPEINPIEPIIVTVGQTVKGIVAVNNEPQGELTTISVDNQPMKLTFVDHGDNTAEYSLKTNAGMAGTNCLVLRASDGVSLDATAPLVITVIAPKRR